MKQLILVFTLCFAIQASSQENSLNWQTDFETAKEISNKENKPILVYFTGSDWCSPCKMLKKDFFETAEFKDRAEKMVLLMVDMPRRIDIITPAQKEKNLEMVRTYNRQGSYPTIVALNNQGHILGEIGGYTFLRETNKHFAFVDSVLENYL